MRIVSMILCMLQGINDIRTVLRFIKNDQSLFRRNLLTAGHHQILQNAADIFCGLKELPEFFMFFKVKICHILIAAAPELLQDPGFADLTHPLQNKGLATGRILPFYKLFKNESFHDMTSHAFMRYSVL